MKHITRKLLTLAVLCCFAVFALAAAEATTKKVKRFVLVPRV